MLTETGARLINRAEQKFGHLAIPNILRWVAGFQLLVFGLSIVSPEMGEFLIFNRGKILQGEIWRLVSFVVMPGTTSILLIIFVMFFLWFVNDGLEQAWGSFRLNLYLLATIFCLSAVGMLPMIGLVMPALVNFVLFTAMFFAFASIYPNAIINLFGVIPIKAKWLAWANVGYLVYAVIKPGVIGLMYVLPGILAGLLPFFCVFLPGFIKGIRQASVNAARRGAYEEQVREAEGEAFHACSACGKTDHSDPDLEFRVTSDGEEYCVDCLPSRNNQEAEVG